MKFSRILLIGAGSFSTAVLLGCVSMPPPTTQAALARTAVDSAMAAGAKEFAPTELQAAIDKVGKMNSALSAREYERARNLAEAAEMDARLAETKTRSAKAEQAAEELQQEISTLKLEPQTR
jgi:hypothetical protein